MCDTMVFIAVGSNIDPEWNITKALERLGEVAELTAVSTFYRSAPLSRPEQPMFLNGACAIRTSLAPRALKFDVLRDIECKLGRVRTDDAYAARPIDLDIALFGNVVLCEPDMVVPDPEIRERPFLCVPLVELAPDAVLPDTGELLCTVAARMDGRALLPDKEFTRLLKARLSL